MRCVPRSFRQPARRLGILLAWTVCQPTLPAASNQVLWEIGRPDNQNGEFALAPGDYARFRADGVFIVGQSEARRDWPYVHPGPADGWAGRTRHAFSVVFGLKQAPTGGTCRLSLDLLDTHGGAPPRVRITLNGHALERQLPAGAGDASVSGQPGKGREARWDLDFPADQLRAGNNDLVITTLSGSWMLYDALSLSAPTGTELAAVTPETRIMEAVASPVWLQGDAGPRQPVRLGVLRVGEPVDAEARFAGRTIRALRLEPGLRTFDLEVPARDRVVRGMVELAQGSTVLAGRELELTPPALREIWVLPHSHVDIGYTHRQDEVIEIQIRNLEQAIALARASADRPSGERYRWNPEAVWVLDHFLQRASPERRESFVRAVREGDVGVDALYANMLTGLCRPEELAQCLRFAGRMTELTGVPVETAAICDVPGWTWGLVSMLSQAGVKYFAIGPNYSARIGSIHQWDNRPFYWRSPSGRERVLCYVVDNYHFLGDLEEQALRHIEHLQRSGYAYDLAPLFWVGTWPDGGVDNAPPDAQLVEKVAAWNRKYAAPRVAIGRNADFFRALEQRHGARLPEFAGDLTPYWEDGAGSTARETAMNRDSAERLVQAETLFALRRPADRPAARFEEAWKNVLLYSEHTWGAWCSISKPDDPFTLDQWRVKQAFALDAARQAAELLEAALASQPSAPPTHGALETFEVLNTTQWPRTDLVILTADRSRAAADVRDSRGRPVPCQRLASGDLAFVARDVPAFGARQYRLTAEPSRPQGQARVEGHALRTSNLEVELDGIRGSIRSLKRPGLDHEFVDPRTAVGMNDFRYLLGTNAAGAEPNGPASFEVLDAGPLVVTVRLTSTAPGCRSLVREIRLIDGLDRVECHNHVDRLSVRENDGVHFGFGFRVPGATIRMETPWAVVRPNADQLPGSCRNWFTVQRWVDVSNDDVGITWAPLDAPLMQIGAMTANLLGPVNLDEWLGAALESSTLYSWAQNNHWFTNYKIDQPGVTTFRYFLRPHAGGYRAEDAARFGLETTRPLLVRSVEPRTGTTRPALVATAPDVLVESVKASEDGRGIIVRLFGVTGERRTTRLRLPGVRSEAWRLTDLSEKPGRPAGRSIEVPGYGVVMVRAERPGS